MTSITQKINSVNGGISQQPDELKIPGQVVTAKNVFPDVTHGLQKRPGSMLVGSLSDFSGFSITGVDDTVLNSQTNGKWFSYYRDENEQYIGQISRTGHVNMWKCSNGQPMIVKLGALDWVASTSYSVGDKVNNNNNIYICTTAGTSAGSGGPSGTGTGISDNNVVWDFVHAASELTNYLLHTDDDHIQTLTLNDFTFINNRTKPTAMLTGASDLEPTQPNQAFIELKQVKYASQYGLELYDSTTNTTQVSTATRLKVSYNRSNSDDASTATNTNGTAKRFDLDTDGTCNSVGTQLFAVSYDDTNSYRALYTGGPVSWNSSNNTYTSTITNRGKDLIFRITTTGQPTTTGGAEPSYSCRYSVKIDLLHGGTGWNKNDKIIVRMTLAHSVSEYVVTVAEVAKSQIATNRAPNQQPIRPTPTPFDNETAITGDMILGKLREGITGSTTLTTGNDFETEQIGNGIYVKATSGGPFNVSTPVSELLRVLTNEIQDVADLPRQCKEGYVVKVRNSANDEDDYYVKFLANNKISGEGVWEECAKPGRAIKFDKSTMPIQLVRTNPTTFILGQIDYDDCPVGDEFTAPEPSFMSPVPASAATARTINKMIFFRNRLVFLSDENVIMSRPGDFFNFWPKSAIAASAEDPIDLSCSSEYPAIVFDGIQVNTGLVLFTENQQFMLTTDSDVLSPLTAKINALSTYNFNVKTNPISLGTTIAFLDNAGKFTRMFEMASVLREGEPVILEQSKVISKLFPKNINLIANSRENSFIIFAEKDSPNVYGFRYYTAAEKRIMQSWITWELSGNIQHLCMLDDAVYAVVRNGSTDVMQKFNLKLSGEAEETITNDGKDYRVHLDNIKSVQTAPGNIGNTYDQSLNRTTLAKPPGFASTKQLVAYDIDANTNELGSYAPVTVSGNQLFITGDWSNQTFLIGYLYEMEVEFPKFYVTQQSGERFISDVQSNLVIHRVKLNFGPLGAYDTKVKRLGKTDYDETHESTFADQYNANKLAIDTEQEVTVPIYERNKNYTLILKSSKPTPATLYSLAWEGDYSNAFYKRV